MKRTRVNAKALIVAHDMLAPVLDQLNQERRDMREGTEYEVTPAYQDNLNTACDVANLLRGSHAAKLTVRNIEGVRRQTLG